MGDDSARAPMQKGPVHQAIDELVNKKDKHTDDFLKELRALPQGDQRLGYIDVLKRFIPKLTNFNSPNVKFSNLLHYLHDTWYLPYDDVNPPLRERLLGLEGFWPHQCHPTEPIVRKGLIKAIDLAITTGFPMESFWILTDTSPDTSCFKTLVIQNQNARLITRLILTPTPKRTPPADYIANAADIWVIKKGRVEPYETLEDASGPEIVTRLNITSSSWQWPES